MGVTTREDCGMKFKFRMGKGGRLDFLRNEFVFCKKDLDDCGCFVHEFTEICIIAIIKNWSKTRWGKKIKLKRYYSVHFKGYEPTYIEHFISPYGINNGRTLIPETRESKKNW